MALEAESTLGHYEILAPLGAGALDPTGRTLALPARTGGLVLLDLVTGAATRVGSSEALERPVFSPDGSEIAAETRGRDLVLVTVETGSVRDLGVDCFCVPRWESANEILYSDTIAGAAGQGIWSIDPVTGESRPLTRPNPDLGERIHRRAQRLDSDHLLLSVDDGRRRGGFDHVWIAVNDLRTGKNVVVQHRARFVRLLDSTLIFYRDGGVWTVQFDRDALSVVGEPTLRIRDVMPWGPQLRTTPYIGISDTGDLVTHRLEGRSELLILDREGKERRSVDLPGWINVAAMKGSRLAAHRDGALWILNLNTDTWIELGQGAFPVWSSDGQRIFALADDGSITAQPADGSAPAEILIDGKNLWEPASVMPRGGLMLVGVSGGILRWEPGWDEPLRWSETGNHSRVSPDGSHVVYERRYADGKRVFVEPTQKSQGQRVAIGNGRAPRFREDGREIVWCDGRKVMSVALDEDKRPTGLPQELFRLDFDPPCTYAFDVLDGGESFLFVRPPEKKLILHLDWLG